MRDAATAKRLKLFFFGGKKLKEKLPFAQLYLDPATIENLDIADYGDALEQARALIDAGCGQDAERTLDSFAAIHPGRPGAFVCLAAAATRRADWPLAVQRWQDCIRRFPQTRNAEWRRARAWALLQLRRFDEAEAEFLDLAEFLPDDAQIATGLARCAVQAQDWPRALDIWTRLCRSAGGKASPDWQAARANSLSLLGRSEEAIDAYRAILDDHPAHPAANNGVITLLQRLGRKTQAEAHLRAARAQCGNSFTLAMQGASLAFSTSDMKLARDELRDALRLAETPEQISACFDLLPRVLQGWALTSAWLGCEARLNDVAGPGIEATQLAMRLRLALGDHDGFLALWDKSDPDGQDLWSCRFRRLAAILRAPGFPDMNAEKIIGIGLPKTGTSSLHAAFQELGYLSAHYTNPFTGVLLTAADTFLFDAMSDSTAAILFEEIYHAFPNARFVVTTRPAESWAISFEKHVTRYFGVSSYPEFADHLLTRRDALPHDATMRLQMSTLWRGHDTALGARQAWHDRVDRFIAAHDAARFLRLDFFAGDAWQKLCAFLGKPVPATAFPHDNKSDRISVAR